MVVGRKNSTLRWVPTNSGWNQHTECELPSTFPTANTSKQLLHGSLETKVTYFNVLMFLITFKSASVVAPLSPILVHWYLSHSRLDKRNYQEVKETQICLVYITTVLVQLLFINEVVWPSMQWNTAFLEHQSLYNSLQFFQWLAMLQCTGQSYGSCVSQNIGS